MGRISGRNGARVFRERERGAGRLEEGDDDRRVGRMRARRQRVCNARAHAGGERLGQGAQLGPGGRPRRRGGRGGPRDRGRRREWAGRERGRELGRGEGGRGGPREREGRKERGRRWRLWPQAEGERGRTLGQTWPKGGRRIIFFSFSF
uniref:Uncharacterized protein n=1 Tax=Oryza sativa subsp. japonica TaxID=39947 RepID=Q69TS3_ORYSJ|nr:hypothetical protein [Oryza sativa Japonica Group]